MPKKADLKIVDTPLADFCKRYNVTSQALADLAGGVGRSTAHRLMHDDPSIGLEMGHKLMHELARELPRFLTIRGLERSAVDAEMLKIFTKGEYQPMITQRIELTADELRWFGLGKDPFSEFPQSRSDVFISPDLQRVIDRVIDAIKYPAFIAVTGDIGAGKTVIRAMVEDYCEQQQNVHVIWPEFMDMQKISPIQIGRSILRHFGATRLPSRAEDLGTAVKQCLQREFQGGSRISIAFDECHRLNDQALSSLKNFYEMGSGGFQRYLSVLLFGQPHFTTRLYEGKFRELNERIIPNPMPEFKTYAAEYMAHRLRLAGADTSALFDGEAIEYVCRQASTPLQLGNIANQALRISKAEFDNRTVVGAAIKTKMFFANGTEPMFKRRAA